MPTHQVRHICKALKASTQKPIPIAIGTKEPALFQRFRDTPYFGGHRHSVQITKTKGEHTTAALAAMGARHPYFSKKQSQAAVRG